MKKVHFFLSMIMLCLMLSTPAISQAQNGPASATERVDRREHDNNDNDDHGKWGLLGLLGLIGLAGLRKKNEVVVHGTGASNRRAD